MSERRKRAHLLQPRIRPDMLAILILQPLHFDVAPQGLQYAHAIALAQVEYRRQARREGEAFGSMVEVEGEAKFRRRGGAEGDGETCWWGDGRGGAMPLRASGESVCGNGRREGKVTHVQWARLVVERGISVCLHHNTSNITR